MKRLMTPRNPNYMQEVKRLFSSAPFITDLGMKLVSADPGQCRSRMPLTTRHQQQDGFVHAGAITTMADHTAGAAAATLIGADEIILSVEFKINFLRAARGEVLECRADVVKGGRRLSIVESEVCCLSNGKTTLVSKALLTMAVVPKTAASAGKP